MQKHQIIAELEQLWRRADADSQYVMVQWTKEHERKIEWPLFPELLAAYAESRRRDAEQISADGLIGEQAANG